MSVYELSEKELSSFVRDMVSAEYREPLLNIKYLASMGSGKVERRVPAIDADDLKDFEDRQ